jgi:hypothetical protein
MNDYLDRIHHFKGTAREIGLAIGRRLGHRLEQTFTHYIRILADDKIERRINKLITAYSNVACPGTGEIWYTFGGYPSACKGNWQRLEWPWPD